MTAVRQIMWDQGWATAILVSNAFHMRRLKSMAKDLTIIAFSSPTPFSGIRSTEWRYFLNEARVYLGYELGHRP